ncbi:P-type conjugative transfer protein TrbJ [Asticcacaulis endophyticus]|uniref:Conjugal transfer protein TrbJ n=1 Tax=Asticcacaulis endophyticus TaxID=1395890 RepID=A0A918USM6_9CAUL|nr:P-type conjugative transfer protein TrbJ [Asticcacaulis endophyticus]GGZ32274.1 conjugal transfer protein TrbJ [Asticcacaulis endophyticus]
MTIDTKRRALLASALCLAGSVALPGAADAQLAVYDPANYVQNVLSAVRALQQINNQITMIQNQATSLVNQARNLANLPYSALSQLQTTINRTRQLIAQAQNIAYNVARIDEAFQSIYGSVSLTASNRAMITDAKTRWANTVGGLQDALRTQATVVGNIDDTQIQMSALVSASQSATGALAATQAGNQILALQTQQLADLTTILAANGRADALKAAEAATAAEQGREQRKRFLNSTSGYQPGAAQMFYGN